jgi:hypothetical protein
MKRDFDEKLQNCIVQTSSRWSRPPSSDNQNVVVQFQLSAQEGPVEYGKAVAPK